MISRIRAFLTPPVFEDEEESRIARLLYAVLLTFLGAMVMTVPVIALMASRPPTPTESFTGAALVIMIGLAVVLLALVRRGWLRGVSIVFLSLLWIIMAGWTCAFSGLKGGTSLPIFPMIIVLAGLLLGGRAAMVATLASIVAFAVAFGVETAGWLRGDYGPTAVQDVLFIGMPVLLTGILLRYAMHSMADALDRARRNEQAQIEANRELEAIRVSLEERVAERTQDLEHRSAQLAAAVEVGRTATSLLEAEHMVSQVVQLIHDQFQLTHVGLFQIDTTGLWAVYRAGAGPGSQELVEQGYRLEVGGQSMVGWCAARAEVRVAQDVRREAGRLDHPLVPGIRSEAGLPLRARGNVIGVLTVQSDQLAAFDVHTLAALETIAEQLATAMDNARLFGQTQHALETARRAYGERSRQAWLDFLQARGGQGFVYSRETIASSLQDEDWQPEMAEAGQMGRSVVRGPLADKIQDAKRFPRSVDPAAPGPDSQAGEPASGTAGQPDQEPAGPRPGGPGRQESEKLAVPLLVRGQTVGVLGLEKAAVDGAWSADEVALIEDLAGQMGAALESAQLFEETQRRAARDRLISEATARLRETLDVETVLQAAIREIGQALSLAEVEVRMLTPPPSGVASHPERGEGMEVDG